MANCEEILHYKTLMEQKYASPEMVKAVRIHMATCVFCGGTMPSYDDLKKIFKDMFAHVGHQEVCEGNDCPCGDDPPSLFETQVVRQFKKT